MEMRRVMVTHKDLDGVACGIIGKAAYPELEVYYEGYDTVDDRLTEILTSFKDEGGIIYITDLSPKSPITAKMLDKFNNQSFRSVLLLDHHESAKERLQKYGWANFNIGVCGAMILYTWLSGCTCAHRIKRFSEFIKFVNDYDMWEHKYPESKQLNYLLAEMGRELFIERCLTRPAEYINDTDELFIRVHVKKLDKYCESSIKSTISHFDEDGRKVGVVFCDNMYASEVGNHILDNSTFDYVAMIDMRRMTVSLRSRIVDVGAIAVSKGGGGHKRSAGYKIKVENVGGLL